MSRTPFDMVGYANSLMSGWPEAMAEARRPAEGDTKTITETRTAEVKCVYPEPDDGASYSWVKVMGE
tara:strand:- start:145 stop:345 length:201 start_codon:yes stop_codon:yes gene_type:complete